jgi:putative ABC transport system ATP-binding protein
MNALSNRAALQVHEFEPSIMAQGISKSFQTGKTSLQVIDNLSIDLFPGELTLIVGPSGCGKSTLLALLSGLLRPDLGRVVSLGHELPALEDRALEEFRLGYCGFIFQGFNLFSSLSAMQQVALVLKYMNLKDDEAEAAALRALDMVGLGSKANLLPLELSGGEKQRVAIARAIVKDPKLVFADEPTSALDGGNGQMVISLLKDFAHNKGSTVLCVTHDHRLFSHADRIISLEDGIITQDQRQAEQK